MAAAKHTYIVLVGNVGQTHVGKNLAEAKREFNMWVETSMDGAGRAGGEDVTLFRGNEIVREFDHGAWKRSDKRHAAKVARLAAHRIAAAAGQPVAPTIRPVGKVGPTFDSAEGVIQLPARKGSPQGCLRLRGTGR